MPRLQGIQVAQGRRLPKRAVEVGAVEAGNGIVGDRYHGTRHRHVGVQSAEASAQAGAGHGAGGTDDWDALHRTLVRDHHDVFAANPRSRSDRRPPDRMAPGTKAAQSRRAARWLT